MDDLDLTIIVFQQVCFNITESSSDLGNIDFLSTSLPVPLEKEARFHRLRAFPFFSLQFELVLAVWFYTVANVPGKRNKPLKLSRAREYHR